MFYIGISGYYHESSVFLTDGININCFLKEEYFTRIKGDKSFPKRSPGGAQNRLKVVPREKKVIQGVLFCQFLCIMLFFSIFHAKKSIQISSGLASPY